MNLSMCPIFLGDCSIQLVKKKGSVVNTTDKSIDLVRKKEALKQTNLPSANILSTLRHRPLRHEAELEQVGDDFEAVGNDAKQARPRKHGREHESVAKLGPNLQVVVVLFLVRRLGGVNVRLLRLPARRVDPRDGRRQPGVWLANVLLRIVEQLEACLLFDEACKRRLHFLRKRKKHVTWHFQVWTMVIQMIRFSRPPIL